MNKYEGILIDFDGVVSKTSVQNSIDFIYKFINSLQPISKEYIYNYSKAIMSFPLQQSLTVLFKSLGLESQLDNFYQKFHAFDKDPKAIRIEKDFYIFLSFLEKEGIDYKILSLASKERLNLLKLDSESRIYSLKDRSKADPNTFIQLTKDLGVKPKKWIYIDDSPVGLRAAKLSNFKTAMMINTVFTLKDYAMFETYIDFKITSLYSLQKKIRK